MSSPSSTPSSFSSSPISWGDEVEPLPAFVKVGVPVTSYSCVESANVPSTSPASEPSHEKICPQGANCKYSKNFEHCKKVLEVYLNKKSAARKAGGEVPSTTPCKFGPKCTRGMKCPFVHEASSAAENLTSSPAIGGEKNKPSVNILGTQICTYNLQTGECPRCKNGSCAFAPSWEALHASHYRELKKNHKFTVDVAYRPELEQAPYNGVRSGNGKISLSPAAYCVWIRATLSEHKSADQKLAYAREALIKAHWGAFHACMGAANAVTNMALMQETFASAMQSAYAAGVASCSVQTF